mgnify:FL=1
MVKNLNPKEIIKTIEQHKDDLNRYSVKKIGLFGSFLKRTTHKKSDIDLLVSFKETTFDNYMELKFMLEKLFHKKVDLVIEENLKPSLKYIKNEAIYAKAI